MRSGGTGGRVVKSLGGKLPPKVLGSDEIICKYLPLRVYPMCSVRVYSLFPFVSVKLTALR